MKKKTVGAALLGGFQDTLPGKLIPLQEVTSKIRSVYESFGFVPLDTPGMERLEVLTGGSTEFNKSIFRTRVVRGMEDKKVELLDEEAAMRFDLTVPLARVVAMNQDLPKPFKRYQMGKVWRGEKPQNNRYREFTQFDIDIIGAKSIQADTEIVHIMYTTLIMLGLADFKIRINDRRILNGLAEVLGCIDKCKELDRIIDKVDSIGIEGVLEELTSEKTEGLVSSELRLSPEKADVLKTFLQIKAGGCDELIRKINDFFEAAGSQSAEAKEGIEAMKQLSGNLKALGIPQKFWVLDLSIARGLDYYTGPVFETIIEDMPEVGSIFSGGRFDGLVDRFIADSNMCGVGASIGVERLMTVLAQKGLVKERSSLTQVVVSIFDSNLTQAAMLCADQIRKAGLKTELYLGNEKTFRGQITAAIKIGARFVIIIGPDEDKQNKWSIKDLENRSQETLTPDEAIAKITSILM